MQAFFLKERSITNRYCKIVSLILNFLLTLDALCNFLCRYVFFAERRTNNILGSLSSLDFRIFLIDFYVFFSLFVFFIFGLVLINSKWFCIIALIVTAVSANLCLYTIYELFTLKVFIFSAWVLTVSIKFRPRNSIPILIFGCASFILFQFYPSFMGIVPVVKEFTVEYINDLYGIACIFICEAFLACIYRSSIYITEWYDDPIDSAFEMICWLKENEKI